MNVYFVASPSQDAWIDFTLAVTEVFWLLPDEARPEGITEAGQLFDGMVFETAGLRVSPESEENIPMQPLPYVEERMEFFQRPDFFHRLVLILQTLQISRVGVAIALVAPPSQTPGACCSGGCR